LAEPADLEEAIVDEILDRGYANATVAGVCRRAAVGREEFQSRFEDLEDGYCQVLERLRDEIIERLLAAFLTGSTWRERIRAVACAMFDFIEEDRRRARFMYIEVFAAGERAQTIREGGTAAMVELIDQGRQELEHPDRLSRATAEAIAGSVFRQIRAAIERDDPRANDLMPQLMYSVVLPYLGAEEALRELEIPPPQPLP